MKVCLPLQKRSSILSHAIAYLLAQKHGIKEFCGFATFRVAEEFLGVQKDIRYRPLLIEEDLYKIAQKEVLDIDYMKSLEKDYGFPSLWPFILVDRHFMMSWPKEEYSLNPMYGHKDLLKHLQVRFREITRFLKEAKPDFVVSLSVGSMGVYILQQAAKKLGIKTIIIEHTRVADRVTVTDNCYNNFSGINRVFDSLRQGIQQSQFKKEAEDYLKNFREHPKSRRWEEKNAFSFFDRTWKAGNNFIKLLVSYIKDKNKKNYYLELDPRSYLKGLLLKNLRKLWIPRGIFEKPRDSEDYAFFPLHVEPETATMLLAPFYTNQIALIQNIAKSLPVHFKLYVKDHPEMLGPRPLSYYKELKRIPNVRLIDTKVDSVRLMKKAKIILTITGTAGWEALLLKKPVITFGSVFYNKLSQVKHCDNIKKLPFLIRECLENDFYKEDELVDFISAVFEYSASFDFINLWQKASFEEIIGDEKFRQFVDFLAETLKSPEKIESDK